jgi:hypothetical protein
MTRKRALDVYIQEAQAYGPKQWKLKWFQVKDRGLYPGNAPNKSEEDQTQGIYLRATSETQIMDRWVLINAHGTHQSIVLIRPNSNEGESAYSFIDQSIRSIKMDHQLESGRELINQALSEIDLDEIQKESNLNTRLNRLLDIQTLLISKLSLEPSSMETFFHLAGTSSLLIQKPDPKHFFWTSLAQSNLKASYLYARDLAPQDPKTAQIQALWMGLNQPEHTEMNF